MVAARTRPRAPSKKPRGADAAPALPDPAALAKELERELAVIAEADARGAAAWDRKYEAVGRILAQQAWRAGAWRSVEDFCQRVLHETRSLTYRSVRVARFATPADEAHFGVSKLDAALDWLEARVGHALGGDALPVRFEKLRVPVKRGDATHRVGLEELTVKELQAATRALRHGGDGAAPKAPEATKLLSTLSGAALPEVQVRYHDGYFDLSHVASYELEALAHALLAHLRPPSAAAPATKKTARKKAPERPGAKKKKR